LVAPQPRPSDRANRNPTHALTHAPMEARAMATQVSVYGISYVYDRTCGTRHAVRGTGHGTRDKKLRALALAPGPCPRFWAHWARDFYDCLTRCTGMMWP
jgi:hypothetical protein